MRVKFHSHYDGWPRYQGFKAHFEAVSVRVTETCWTGNIYNENLTLTGNYGTLKSPMTYYPPNMYCKWLITVPEGKFVELTFNRIQFPSRRCLKFGFRSRCLEKSNCPEYVEVWNGTNHTTYCGRLRKKPEKGKYYQDYHLPGPIRSSGWNMTVIFRSYAGGVGQKYTGFEATFKAVDENRDGNGLKIGIGVSVSVVFLIALVVCIICFVKRRKARNRANRAGNADGRTLTTTATTTTTPASQATRINRRPSQAREQRINGARIPMTTANATTTTAFHATQTLRTPRQAPNQPTNGGRTSATAATATTSIATQTDPPPVQTSVQITPSLPPPAYPYALDSPPPYPGVEGALQFPPPGESYPWLQNMAPVEPSAPPESP